MNSPLTTTPPARSIVSRKGFAQMCSISAIAAALPAGIVSATSQTWASSMR